MENSSDLIPSLTLDPCKDEKSTIRRHLLGWPFLGITPKLLICNGIDGRGLQPYIEPPCWPGNHQWPWNCEMQTVYFSWQPRVWEQVEPQTETMLEAFKDISNCLLIRVPSQVESKLRHIQWRHTNTGWKAGHPMRGKIAPENKRFTLYNNQFF